MAAAQWWSERSSAERIAMATSAVILVGVAVAAAIWAVATPYQPLFTQLSPQDANLVANRLVQQGIRVQVDTDGTRVLVARDDIRRARMTAAEEGLPLSPAMGFELFDDADFGMTDFTQRINYQRALEGELTRTISTLREVVYARLHLVLPENSLFAEKSHEPKAALTVALKPGAALTGEQILGIQRLVAASVPGLSPELVTVHDQDGVSLAGGVGGRTDSKAVLTRIQAKREVEGYLTVKAQDVLDRMFGAGSAAVSVDVELDFDQKQISRDEVLPIRDGATGAVRSLRSYRDNSGAGGQSRRADDGMGPGPAAATTEVEYESGRRSERIEVTQGAITRLTLGVLLPSGLASEEQIRARDVVANAVGFSEDRGDRIAVHEMMSVPAQAPTAARAERAVATGERGADSLWPVLDIAKISGLQLSIAALVAVLVILAAWMLGRRSARGRLSEEDRRRLLTVVQRLVEPESGQEPLR